MHPFSSPQRPSNSIVSPYTADARMRIHVRQVSVAIALLHPDIWSVLGSYHSPVDWAPPKECRLSCCHGDFLYQSPAIWQKRKHKSELYVLLFWYWNYLMHNVKWADKTHGVGRGFVCHHQVVRQTNCILSCIWPEMSSVSTHDFNWPCVHIHSKGGVIALWVCLCVCVFACLCRQGAVWEHCEQLQPFL